MTHFKLSTDACSVTAAASIMGRAKSSTGAVFSSDWLYRYLLWRRWSDEPMCAFIGLNPSTADEREDDPTIRRCIGFAKRWGHGGLIMLNIFALRATDPKTLWRTEFEQVGSENNAYLIYYAAYSSMVVCAWGAHGTLQGRGNDVRQLLWEAAPGKTLCLGQTQKGLPKHPLYLKADTEPVAFT